MNIIYFTAILVFILCFLMAVFVRKDPKSGAVEYSPVLIFAYLLLLIIISGFRYKFIDTTDYRLMYDAVDTTFRAVTHPEEYPLPGVEKGYILYTVLLHYISDDSQILLLVSSCMIILSAGFVIKKYSSDLPYSFILFFLLYFITTMNGMRQIMASSIVSLVILSKKEEHSTLFVLFCIVLAAFLHRSVLLFVPLYFIIRQELANKYIIGLFVLSIVSLLIPSELMSVLSYIVGIDKYTEFFLNSKGMNILRFAESCAVPLLILIFKSKITEDKTMVMLSNLVLISFCFSIMCINNLMFGRITMYFTIYGIILLPSLIEKGFGERAAILVKLVSLMFYTAFFVFQVRAYGGMDNFTLVF